MKQSNQVIIRAPKQHEHRNPEALLNPNEIREWLDTLPILKPDPTIRHISNAIEAINQQKITAKKRTLLLHEYRKTLLQIFPSLDLDSLSRYSHDKQIINQIQTATTRLLLILADGYKIILRDALNDGTAAKDETIVIPLYHAMESLSLAILNCYRAYIPTPKNLYHDIHQIYLLSEHLGLLNRGINDNSLNLSATNIGGIYRQIMTLSFLDPFHMPQGIADSLYARLSSFIEFCTALSSTPDQESSEIFIVDLATDEAPRAIYKISSPEKIKMPRAFDMQSLTNKIKTEIKLLHEKKEALGQQAEIQLLNKLIPAKKENRTRQAERTNSKQTYKVTYGINAAHHFLSLNENELMQALVSSANNFGGYPLNPWASNNESNTGFSLASQHAVQDDICVGDIIYIISNTANQKGMQRKIASIKWVRNNQNHSVNIGAEFIQGDTIPVTCKLKDNDKDESPAIFISKDTPSNTPETLLTPKHIYQRGRMMEITIAGQTIKIEAGFLRDDTFTFDRFDFVRLPS